VANEPPTWADVEASYDDPRLHDAFVNACRGRGDLKHAAECYRAVLAARPGDPVALKRQKQIVALAMLAMNLETARREAERGGEAGTSSGFRLLATLAGLGALLGALGGLAMAKGTAEAGVDACAGGLQGSLLCILADALHTSATTLPTVGGGALVGVIGGLVLGAIVRRPRA
jgi:hypothetical protein